ncbi:hypothetical protein Tco_1176636 [Tanacetum coccineum]
MRNPKASHNGKVSVVGRHHCGVSSLSVEASSQPWTIAEEIALCKAWCDVTENNVTGDAMKMRRFWSEVVACFEKEMGENIRGYDAIIMKWKRTIRPKIATFSAVYNNVQRMNENENDSWYIGSFLVKFGDDLSWCGLLLSYMVTLVCVRLWKSVVEVHSSQLFFGLMVAPGWLWSHESCVGSTMGVEWYGVFVGGLLATRRFYDFVYLREM